MATGTPLLLVLSALAGERWAAPTRPATWYTLVFLVPIGSVGLFILYVFVVQRWTASAASYQFVLFPLVSAVVAALIADEALDASVAIGGLLVVAGVYAGALAPTRKTEARVEAPA